MFSISVTQFIQEVSKPLQSIGLTNFVHDITFGDGQIAMMMGNKNVFNHYHQNKIPTFCTDSNGRTLQDGVYLNKTLENTRHDCALLMPNLIKIGLKYGQNYGKNSLHIVAREDDCQHFYCMFFDLDENDFLQWVINNGAFINDFIDDYKVKHKDTVIEAKAVENRITLPTSEEFFQSTILKEMDETQPLPKIIHKHLGMPIHITKQQGRCLRLLAEGKTAKEIATTLHISHRTVEDYFDKLRKQMGCSSSKKLIAEYGDQLSFL